MAPQSTWPSIIILTRVQPFKVSNSLNAAPFRDRGRFFSDFSRENADNYCLNERNRFAGKLTRLSPKFAPSLSRFFKGVPPYGGTLQIGRSADHLNTQNRWSSKPISNGRRAITCANIKAANVDLYTIQVNTGGDPTSTLLQNCASSTDKFYLKFLSVDPDDHHLQHDRRQPDQVALRSIVAAQRWQTKARLT